MVMHNTHQVTDELRQRVIDMAMSGIPQYIIAKIIGIDDNTLRKHYEVELDTALPEMVARIGKCVAIQAQQGNEKSQALYLKTLGAKYGWVEKQIIEQSTSDDEKQALLDKVKELEAKHERDY